MSSPWPRLAVDRPAPSLKADAQHRNPHRAGDPVLAGPKTAPSCADENAARAGYETKRRHGPGGSDGPGPDGPDGTTMSGAPPSQPLHGRTPSESNRLTAIRVVPYSPPRLDPQPLPQPLDGQTAGSPTSSPRRRRRQRQRQRRNRRSRDGDATSNDEDSDQTSSTTTTTSTATATRRSGSRPTSWVRRASWGPSASLKAAGSGSGGHSGGGSGSSTPSTTSSSRTVVVAGAAAASARPRREGDPAVLAERSSNLLRGPATAQGQAKLHAGGGAGMGPGPGPAWSPRTPAESVFPLARGSHTGVSAPKPAAPATGSLLAAATSGTPVHATDGGRPRQQGQAHGRAPDDAPPPGVDVQRGRRRARYASLAADAQLPPSSPSPSSSASSPSPSTSPQSPSFLSTSYVSTSSSSSRQPTLSSSLSSSLSASLTPSLSTASVTSVSSSQVAPRPNSRRRNLVAVHADKTFSLVPRATAPGARAGSDARPSGTAGAHLASPPLSFVTDRSFSSLERLSSGVFSSDERPSSSLTSSHATTVGRSSTISPCAPSPAAQHSVWPEPSSRPGTSSPTDSASTAWNERPPGSLRKIPKTPDLKRKGKQPVLPSAVSSFSAAPGLLPSLSESSTPSTTTTTTTASAATVVVARAADTPQTSTRLPREKPSFASDHSAGALSTASAASAASSASLLSFSASTLSATTNYKVYAHSSPPAAAAADAAALSAAADASSSSISFPSFSPSPSSFAQSALQSSDSLVLLPSSSGSTNVEILGVSSPAAPPLPVLQRSDDPDQTFASLGSYPSIASFDSGLTTGSHGSSSAPNVVILGASSPPAPLRYLNDERDFASDVPSSPPSRPLRTADTTADTLGTASDSEPNYVLYGEPSALSFPPQSSSSASASHSASASVASIVSRRRQPRPVYSQESLVVPPLKPLRSRRSSETFGFYKSRSRESLRRAASLKSISSIFTQEATSTFFAGQAFLNLNIPPVPVFNAKQYQLRQQQREEQKQKLPGFVTRLSLPRRKPLPLPAARALGENVVVYDRTPTHKNVHDLSDSWDSSSPPQLVVSPSPSLPPSPSSPAFPASPSSPSPSPFSAAAAAAAAAGLTLPQQPRHKRHTAQMVEEHPHQWSSQLSTVLSESDADSAVDPRAPSRSVSPLSVAPSGNEGIRGDVSAASGSVSARRSSAGWASSTHSRNRPSVSSSLALQLDEAARDRSSRGDSIALPDRPGPAFFRNSSSASPTTSGSAAAVAAHPPIRTVRDHDEHGDGLADLHDVGRQPSRTGLSGFFSSSNNSTRNLHSSSSARSLASPAAFPPWARVYYGSGEHRALSMAPSVSSLGDEYLAAGAGGGSRPQSGAFRRSPSNDNLAFNILYARRRAREVQPAGPRPFSDAASVEGGEGLFQQGGYRLQPPVIRKMTSSLWSPHLRVDRRATRFSVWEPPSATWSTDTTSLFDRRNMQIILFTAGFVLPLAWMLAAFLPLPPDPQRAMEKRAASEGEFGVPAALKRRIAQSDETRFLSARWWRTLNRLMSVFGLLIIGAVVALAVVAVRQGWGR